MSDSEEQNSYLGINEYIYGTDTEDEGLELNEEDSDFEDIPGENREDKNDNARV